MLIATITALILIFSGGGLRADLRATVAQIQKWAGKSLENEAKRQRVLEISDAMENLLDAYVEGVRARRGALLVIDSRYESTADDYRRVFRELDGVWDETELGLTNARAQLKKELTREQWEAMYEYAAKKTGRKGG
jgi:hypothetical protein